MGATMADLRRYEADAHISGGVVSRRADPDGDPSDVPAPDPVPDPEPEPEPVPAPEPEPEPESELDMYEEPDEDSL